MQFWCSYIINTGLIFIIATQTEEWEREKTGEKTSDEKKQARGKNFSSAEIFMQLFSYITN